MAAMRLSKLNALCLGLGLQGSWMSETRDVRGANKANSHVHLEVVVRHQ